MAYTFDVTGLTEYIDQTKNEVLTDLISVGDTISRMTLQVGIKYKDQLNYSVSDVEIQPDDCTWSPLGSTTFSKKELEVVGLKVNESYCLKDLNNYFMSASLKAGDTSDISILGPNFISDKVKKIKKEIDQSIWLGDVDGETGTSNLFDGIVTTLSGDTDRETVLALTGVTLTASNIIASIELMVSSRPIEMLDTTNQTLNVSMPVYFMYTKALRTANQYHVWEGDNAPTYEVMVPGTNVKVKGVLGLGTSQLMTLTYDSNLVFGTDLLHQEEDIKIWVDESTDAVNLKLKFKAGVQIYFPIYCVTNY